MKGIKHNGVKVSVQDWSPWKKLPVLVVEFEGENSAYKVAQFKDKATADWFCGIMEIFFEDLFGSEQQRWLQGK